MADVPHFTAPEFIKLGIGFAGALVSLKFLKEPTRQDAFLMLVGGAVLSFVATDPVTTYYAMEKAQGLVGFMLGLFGMAIAKKLHEVIYLVDAKWIIEYLHDRYIKTKSSKKED